MTLNNLFPCMFSTLALTGFLAYAQQTAPPQGTQAAQKPWTEHVRRSTIAFGEIAKDAGGRSFFRTLGAGLVVAIDPHNAYLVTAKHVFDSPELNWHPASLQVRFSWEEDRDQYAETGTTLSLQNDHGSDLWTGDKYFDLAIIPLTGEVRKRVTDAIGIADFANSDETFDGASIFVFGYPGLIGERYQIRALTRAGIIAWTDPSGPSAHEILIDSRIFPGNSGGPVYLTPSGLDKFGNFHVGNRVSFVGIVSKTFNEDTSLQITPFSAARGVVVGAAGVGLIEPASAVKDLLQRIATPK